MKTRLVRTYTTPATALAKATSLLVKRSALDIIPRKALQNIGAFKSDTTLYAAIPTRLAVTTDQRPTSCDLGF